MIDGARKVIFGELRRTANVDAIGIVAKRR